MFCRCRPLSKAETSSGCSTVVDFNASKDGELGILAVGNSKKTFKFDRVYTPKDDQGASSIAFLSCFGSTEPSFYLETCAIKPYIFSS